MAAWCQCCTLDIERRSLTFGVLHANLCCVQLIPLKSVQIKPRTNCSLNIFQKFPLQQDFEENQTYKQRFYVLLHFNNTDIHSEKKIDSFQNDWQKRYTFRKDNMREERFDCFVWIGMEER